MRIVEDGEVSMSFGWQFETNEGQHASGLLTGVWLINMRTILTVGGNTNPRANARLRDGFILRVCSPETFSSPASTPSHVIDYMSR